MVRSFDGVDIAVHDFGGEGPVLIMAHATGFHGLVWQSLASELADHFHCVGFDFRGHGKSPIEDLDSIPHWSAFAGDLLAVADSVSPRQPIRVVGHSMGGAAIALGAAQNPERFVSAWAFEPILAGRDDILPNSNLAQSAARRRAEFESRAAALDNYRSKPPLSILYPQALQDYVEHGFDDLEDGRVTISCRPATESHVFSGAGSDANQAALKMNIPMALVVGSETTGPAQLSRQIADQADHLTLIETDLTHFGPLQDPAAIAMNVREWFE